jgi:2-aminoadipate transaminase
MIDSTRFLSTAARSYQESAIRKTGALASRVPDLISFAAGSPSPEMFPWDALASITGDLLARRDGNVLQYGATRGYRPLIEQIIAHVDAKGIRTTAEAIVVTTGSQQGLDLVGRVLIDPGDVVLVELPTYSGAIAAFHNLQAALVGVPQDGDGIDVNALAEILRSVAAEGRRCRFVYVTPNFQNPSGRHDLLILEDDPYGSLYFEDTADVDQTRPIKADDEQGRVVYLGSLSKTLVPGLRVAWAIAPPAIVERVELAKQAADLCSGVFDQRIAHLALGRGVVSSLAPRLRAHYMDKRNVMEGALAELLPGRVRWQQPRGGFFIWMELVGNISDRVLFDRAVDHKVSFVVGSAFFVNGEGHRFARLSFSAPSQDRIREGVKRLAAAFTKDAAQ